jgi:hypothetical protein
VAPGLVAVAVVVVMVFMVFVMAVAVMGRFTLVTRRYRLVGSLVHRSAAGIGTGYAGR